MTLKFQKSQHRLLETLQQKGLIPAAEMKRLSTSVDRAVSQKRSSDVLSTATLIHTRITQALDKSIQDVPEQREAQEIEILQGVVSLVQSVPAIEELFDKSLTILRKAVNYESATIFLLDREEDRLEPVLAKGGHVDLIGGVRFDMGQGLSAWVAKKKKPILITELARPPKAGEPLVSSFLSMPLVVQGEMIGVINLSHSKPRAFDEENLRILGLVGGVLASALERARTQRELKRQSVCDRLTGLYTRRHFQERLAGEIERAHRHYQAFSLLLVDVDALESFNARYGHAAGDRVLVEISRVLQRWSRGSDLLARYAGEEFAILMPATGPAEAAAAAERLRQCVETHTFPQKRRTTVSLGAASFPEDAHNALDLLAKAEQALHMAKKDGRNRSVAFHALAVH
jgi:diguanylate cyclase (GGDEF)-like protein